MENEQLKQLKTMLKSFDPSDIKTTADDLRSFWMQFDPKSMHVIKKSQREQQETIGIPVAELKMIGKELGKAARKNIDGFLPLVRLLWESYGREGRVVAVIPLGDMELEAPQRLIPEIKALCRSCLTWEDADRIAMDGLEPIIRKSPQDWLGHLTAWVEDENLWVRRAAVIVIGRLPMKHSTYTESCLLMVEPVLGDPETDVKRAVSFAIRLMVRGDVTLVHDFLANHIPPRGEDQTWVLCDVMRSMTKSFLGHFVDLLPLYEKWAKNPSLTAREKKSINSVIELLKKIR